jgi:chromosome segregation ATPase
LEVERVRVSELEQEGARVRGELEVERVRVSELEQEGARVRGELEVERVRVSELEQEGAKDQRDRDEALRKLNDLEVTNQELKARQALFEKEFDKAEGQLELIKELITLRDLAGSTQQSEAK